MPGCTSISGLYIPRHPTKVLKFYPRGRRGHGNIVRSWIAVVPGGDTGDNRRDSRRITASARPRQIRSRSVGAQETDESSVRLSAIQEEMSAVAARGADSLPIEHFPRLSRRKVVNGELASSHLSDGLNPMYVRGHPFSGCVFCIFPIGMNGLRRCHQQLGEFVHEGRTTNALPLPSIDREPCDNYQSCNHGGCNRDDDASEPIRQLTSHDCRNWTWGGHERNLPAISQQSGFVAHNVSGIKGLRAQQGPTKWCGHYIGEGTCQPVEGLPEPTGGQYLDSPCDPRNHGTKD